MQFIKNYFLVFLKGLGMGAADVVPGVSGGTIAFITGIYEELINTISGINLGLLKTLKSEGFKSFWNKANGNFLLALLAGIAVSILSLAKVFKYLLHEHPIQLWAFFFGLIIASILYMGKQVEKWDVKSIFAMIVGTAAVVTVSVMPAMSNSENLLYLFICGMIAISAMILPGISGSFILLILGVYPTILGAVDDMDVKILAVVAAGCGIGLLAFSRALKWVFKHHKAVTIALLTGFLIGSLMKVWPWKATDTVSVKKDHQVALVDFSEFSKDYQSLSAFHQNVELEEAIELTPIEEHNVSPQAYSEINSGEKNHVIFAILFAILGFSLIFVLDKFAPNKEEAAP